MEQILAEVIATRGLLRPNGLAMTDFVRQRLFAFVFTFVLCGCASAPLERDYAITRGSPPRRTLIVAFQGLAPTPPGLPDFSGLQNLKEEGVLFTDASLGHLPHVPALSYLVMFTGKQPKHLPFQSGLVRGEKRALIPLDAVDTRDDSTDQELFPLSSPFISPSERQRRFFIAEQEPDSVMVSSLLAMNHWTKSSPPRILAQSKTAALVTQERMKLVAQGPDWQKFIILAPTQSLTQADAFLGELFNTLREVKRYDDTLIVVTSVPTTPKAQQIVRPQPFPKEIRNLGQASKIEAIEWDSTLRVWLHRSEDAAKVANDLKQLPHAFEVYSKEVVGKTAHYIRHSRQDLLKDEALQWALSRHQGLVDSFAAPKGPDLVVLFEKDGESALRASDKIAFWVKSPNLRKGSFLSDSPIILADIPPTITRLTGENTATGIDGDGTLIERFISRD